MTEREFQRTVIELAQIGGWMVHAERPATNRRGQWATHIQGHAGLPDLLMTRGSRIVFAELKSARGSLRPMQRMWLDRLEATGKAEVYCWRPKDMETIKETLL